MIAYDKGIRLDFEKIPLNDEKTFELFRAGDMTGIFQFESDGMRDALTVDSTESNSKIFLQLMHLYRPGPMDNIPLYSRRKNDKEKITYIHPQLEPVLEETYGVIVYQEQIMQIAVRVAGFTMGEADLLRRAISKKNREISCKKNEFISHKVRSNNGFPRKCGYCNL